MLLEVRGHLLVPQPPRLPLPQAGACPPQLCKWATKPTKTDQRIIWNKKLLQARSPNWFGGQLRSLAVAKPATPMERFDEKKHLLGKTTSSFHLDRNFFYSGGSGGLLLAPRKPTRPSSCHLLTASSNYFLVLSFTVK